MSNPFPETTDAFNKYLLRFHYIPSTIPAVTKAEKKNPYSYRGGKKKQKRCKKLCKMTVFQLQMGTMEKNQAGEGVGREVAIL